MSTLKKKRSRGRRGGEKEKEEEEKEEKERIKVEHRMMASFHFNILEPNVTCIFFCFIIL